MLAEEIQADGTWCTLQSVLSKWAIQVSLLHTYLFIYCTEYCNSCAVCVWSVWSGDLEAVVESARFLLLLSKLSEQQSRYEDHLSYMSKAKEVQDRCVLMPNLCQELLKA